MRPHLMFADGDFDPRPPAQTTAAELVNDLELTRLWASMARGDELIGSLVRAAMLGALTDPATMTYRQQVLGDCLRNASTVRALYELAEQAIAAERKLLRTAFHARPEALLNRSVRLLEQFGDFLRRLRQLAAGHAGEFRSTGFTQLFQTIRTELDERYLQTVDAVLEQLQFDQGIVASARLGDGNKGVQFVLRVPPGKGRDVPAYRALKRSNLSFAITGADELDWRALAQLRDSILNDIANATAQSSDHIRDFFLALRDELGFYIGCLNLAETLSAIGMPICWPRPHASEEPALSARELYEPCLALLQKRAVVGNDIDADGRSLVMVTGPNRGGKSTFLRSIGVAHLMMQSGMFVAAQQFSASVVTSVFTHYKREEDPAMVSGKFDEELTRMSAIADQLTPGSLLLCNESFASTNEREGSEIAAEIVRALTDVGVRVVFVTHLYELAHRMHTEYPARCLFLRAGRGDGGERTFRLTPGEPSPMAYGADMYTKVFGTGRFPS